MPARADLKLAVAFLQGAHERGALSAEGRAAAASAHAAARVYLRSPARHDSHPVPPGPRAATHLARPRQQRGAGPHARGRVRLGHRAQRLAAPRERVTPPPPPAPPPPHTASTSSSVVGTPVRCASGSPPTVARSETAPVSERDASSAAPLSRGTRAAPLATNDLHRVGRHQHPSGAPASGADTRARANWCTGRGTCNAGAARHSRGERGATRRRANLPAPAPARARAHRRGRTALACGALARTARPLPARSGGCPGPPRRTGLRQHRVGMRFRSLQHRAASCTHGGATVRTGPGAHDAARERAGTASAHEGERVQTRQGVGAPPTSHPTLTTLVQ